MARILVIDDNQTNLDLAVYLLTAFGHEVVAAVNGTDGLERARTHAFDIVLADIVMPELDGYSFARAFKSEESLKNTPLVALTASAMIGDRDKIIGAGFDWYISKPIDPTRFVSEIEHVLRSEFRVQQNDDRRLSAPRT
jgi:two-component system, cell cycle response regulator